MGCIASIRSCIRKEIQICEDRSCGQEAKSESWRRIGRLDDVELNDHKMFMCYEKLMLILMKRNIEKRFQQTESNHAKSVNLTPNPMYQIQRSCLL